MAKRKAAAPLPAPEPIPAADIDPANPHDMQPAAEPVSLEDVQVQPAEPDAPQPKSRHAAQMAEIVAARHREIDRENEYARSIGMGAPDQPASAEPSASQPVVEPQDGPIASVAPQAAPEPSATPASPDAPATTVPGRVHKITVNGREIEMPEADALRFAEQAVFAQAHLQEARRLYDEAQRLRGSAPQPDPSARPSPPAASAPASQPAPSLDRNALLEFARTVLYGDEEKVADATDRLIRQVQPAPQSVDPNAIVQDVTGRVNAQLQLRQDLTTFADEYSDLVKDDDLAGMAGQRAQALRAHYHQTGSPKPELEIMREAGNWVRDKLQTWRGGATPTSEPQPASVLQPVPTGDSPRTVIKRATPNAPAAAGAVPMQSAPRQPTPTDIVNQMRRARGQPVYAQ